jgi:hypothetical protein
MKKLILAVILSLTILTFNPVAAVRAAGLSDSFGSSSLLNSAASASGYKTSSDNNALSIASFVISLVLEILGTIFLCLIFYGGVIWMLAEGNEQRVERAGSIIRQAIIGLIIVISAYGLSYALLKIFSGQLK